MFSQRMAFTNYNKMLPRNIPNTCNNMPFDRTSSSIYEDNHCVVYDEQYAPRAPIHFLVVPKKRIPYFCDPSGNDERLIGHLLIVARKVATDKGLKNFFNIIIDEDKKSSKFKCLHVFGQPGHHKMQLNGPISRL